VRPDVIRAEPLHAKEVDKTIILDTEHICPDISVADIVRDEAQRDREAISFESTQGKRLKNALKTSTFNLRVPVFASLLPDQLLSIGPMNGHPLCCCASFVFVARNLELPRHLPDSFRDVVHSLHSVNVSLQHGNFEILGLSLVLWLAIAHFHLLAGRV